MKELYALKQLQSLPLEAKMRRANNTIVEWCRRFPASLSLSGIDSNFVKFLIDDLNARRGLDITTSHVNTTVEYPELERFIIKTYPETDILLPKKSFAGVIKDRGYPVISKKVSRFVRDLQRPESANPHTRNLRLTGFNQKGIYCPSQICPKKWIFLKDCGFKISEECCNDLKKSPLKEYQKKTGRKPITGIMAEESSMRQKEWLKHGCSLFDAKYPICHPISIFTKQDILLAHKTYGIRYCEEIYGKIEGDYPNLYTTGEQSTGCMGCGFGVHLEKSPNRFQRMQITHPKYWDYFINRLGMGKLLDLINVKYTNEVKPDCSQQ